jgi:hypothetical protein
MHREAGTGEMAYADNKRNAASKDFGPLAVAGLALASALGIGSAVVVEMLQAQDTSSLYMVNRLLLQVTSLFGIEALPLSTVMLLLMGIGAASIVVTEPTTLRGAYAQGFTVLAALVTVTPPDWGVPAGGPAEGPSMRMEQSVRERFEPASLNSAAAQQAEDYQLRIQIEFPEGLSGSISEMLRRKKLVGKLYNPETGVRYDLFRNSGAEMDFTDGTLRLITSVGAASDQGELWILVEAEGYKITEERFLARSGANPIWNVSMQPSRRPLVVQRLTHPYRF